VPDQITAALSRIAFPGADEKWSRSVLRELKELACSGAVRFKLDQLIATLEFHHLSSSLCAEGNATFL
jgi:hypothetical protein